jgi:hypothetical protein
MSSPDPESISLCKKTRYATHQKQKNFVYIILMLWIKTGIPFCGMSTD